MGDTITHEMPGRESRQRNAPSHGGCVALGELYGSQHIILQRSTGPASADIVDHRFNFCGHLFSTGMKIAIGESGSEAKKSSP